MSLLGRLWQVAVVGAALAAACRAGDELDGGGTQGPTNEPSAARGRCPESAPASGTDCTLPEGTTCLFGACGAPVARCSGGVWVYSTVEHRLPCPAQVPDIDERCPSCWPASTTCTYGSCSGPDASPNRALVSCEPGQRWNVRVEPCSDAGADVQGDG